MKTLNITFEDNEFKKLEEKKGGITWHDFVIQAAEDFKG